MSIRRCSFCRRAGHNITRCDSESINRFEREILDLIQVIVLQGQESITNMVSLRRYLLNKEAQKDALPIRLKAFERMTLFLERINPTKLLIRITPLSQDKNEYENYVIAQIEQEFEHNLTQQIYLSDDCWTIIITAKKSIIFCSSFTSKKNSMDIFLSR